MNEQRPLGSGTASKEATDLRGVVQTARSGRRIDYVEVVMKSSWTRKITWEERNEVVAALRKVSNGQSVVDAFEAVGTSRPVELDASASQPMREAVHAMEIRRRSTLTQGLRELRDALVQG